MPVDIAPYGGDDGSSDGGEYLPPSEGEEDLDIDVDYSEPDHWAPDFEDYEDDLDPIPIVHGENAELELPMEDEGIWGSEYDPDLMDEVEEPDSNPEVVGGVDEFDYEPDSEYDPELMGEMEEPSYDPDFTGEEAVEELDYDPDFMEEPDCDPECFAEGPANEPALGSECLVEDDPEILGGAEMEDDHEAIGHGLEDSEAEEQEVEWGLTDGESAASALGDDEVRGICRYSRRC